MKAVIIEYTVAYQRSHTYQCFCHWGLFFSCLNSYDSEGRLMNVTFPTGMVNNLYTDINSALMVDVESSMTEEEISITTNTSTIRAFYTLAQGKETAAILPLPL